MGAFGGFVELSIGGLGDSTENSLGKRADLVNPLSGGGGDPLSTDIVLVLINITSSGLFGVVEGSGEIASGYRFSKV